MESGATGVSMRAALKKRSTLALQALKATTQLRERTRAEHLIKPTSQSVRLAVRIGLFGAITAKDSASGLEITLLWDSAVNIVVL